jgi:predicted ATPase
MAALSATYATARASAPKLSDLAPIWAESLSYIFPCAFVFTGPPCSGKSKTLELVSQEKGWQAIEETGRELILEAKEKGRPDPRMDGQNAFTQKVFDRQLSKEMRIDLAQPCLLDRTIIDCVSYVRCNGGNLTKTGDHQFDRRYRVVFMFDPLPFVQDGVRNNFDLENREKLHASLITTYAAYNHEIIRVPVARIDERVIMVIDRIERYLAFPWSQKERRPGRGAVHQVLNYRWA